MKFQFIDSIIKYDGYQLSSHFAYKNFKIPGNSIIAFAGPVDVKITEMADIEDVLNKEPISSDMMLSFIVETFDINLTGTVWMQRLLMAIMQDELNIRLGGVFIERKGDDLYYKDRKLSVSIATASPVSTLIHSALNIKPTGAPIPISCLDEMKIEYKDFAEVILVMFNQEFEDVEFARMKVNWVK